MIEESIVLIERLTKEALETPNDRQLLELLATRELIIFDLIKEIKSWNF